MVEAVSFSIQREVQLRFLSPADIPEVKKLCTEWFPIEYPDVWYQEIASNPKFYSLAATYHSNIIGLIVCEIKQKMMLNKEDSDILAPAFPSTVQVAYILSLGVVVDYRKHGIGSLLLDSLLSYLTTKEYINCKAAYLHVLSTNHNAIRFYERRNFRAHSYLPYYYSIQGKPRDGYSYVLYINGGQPPWSIFDYLSHCGSVLTKLQPCALPRQIMRTLAPVKCPVFISCSVVFTKDRFTEGLLQTHEEVGLVKHCGKGEQYWLENIAEEKGYQPPPMGHSKLEQQYNLYSETTYRK